MIHHSVTYREIKIDSLFPTDPHLEHQSVVVEVEGAELRVINIYIPPTSSCQPGYAPNLIPLFSTIDDTLIAGDFNAHDPAWYSNTTDTRAAERGEQIADACVDSPMQILNTDAATRVPTNGPTTSPDITFASAHLANGARWEPKTTLNSDHLPILIGLSGWFSSPPSNFGPRCYTNYRKADWPSFTSTTELAFQQLPAPTSCSQGKKVFRDTLLQGSKSHIPRGKIPNFKPGLTPEILTLMQERDTLREQNPAHPHLTHLTHTIETDINSNIQRTWRETMSSCSISRNSRKYWKIFNSLSGKRPHQDPNQPITFNNTTHTNPSKIATQFCRQFARPVPHEPDPHSRQLRRHIRKRHPLDHSTDTFTITQVQQAIQDSGNSTATSPDGLTILHLRHLGPLGLQYLCKLFNFSYRHAELPAIWKHAIIIPLPKPGKLKDQGTSYRPISLLCPASKVLEKLLFTKISPYINLSASQHGFRPGYSTSTALLPLVHQIARGFNQHYPIHRTVAMAVDFSKAFDTVNHTKLLTDIHNTNMTHNTIRWLTTYLRGRTATCKYNNRTSKPYPLHTGVPQGSVLSPILFNQYVSSYPQSVQLATSYADDFTAAVTAKSTAGAEAALAAHAADVTRWAADRALQVSTSKSTVTLFSSQTRELNTQLTIPLNNTNLPMEKRPKILGVTFDPTLTFCAHVDDIARRARQRLSILKALAGSTWGQQKETLLVTYRAAIRSLFTYTAPIWSINISQRSTQKLQTIQNAALRIATGSVKLSAESHLHAEAKMLPVRNHLSLLSVQYLATCLQPTHPSYPIVTADSGPRDMKETLQHKFGSEITRFCVNGAVENAEVARTVLHTEYVDHSIRTRPLNRVLHHQPPDINEEEELTLPRSHRTTLSQLRSGHCSSLNEFRHRIGISDTTSCPSCGHPQQDTAHIFSCPIHPTTLSVWDLWRNPVGVVELLATIPCFGLGALRPPPEPPPQ